MHWRYYSLALSHQDNIIQNGRQDLTALVKISMKPRHSHRNPRTIHHSIIAGLQVTIPPTNSWPANHFLARIPNKGDKWALYSAASNQLQCNSRHKRLKNWFEKFYSLLENKSHTSMGTLVQRSLKLIAQALDLYPLQYISINMLRHEQNGYHFADHIFLTEHI